MINGKNSGIKGSMSTSSGNEFTWMMTDKPDCSDGGRVLLTHSSTVGTCHSKREYINDIEPYYFKVTVSGVVQPSFVPRVVSSYKLTFHTDATCSSWFQSASVTITDTLCSSGSTTTGDPRWALAQMSTDGSFVNFAYYLNTPCTGSPYVSYGGNLSKCYSYPDPASGISYYKIVLDGALQPSASTTPSPSASRTPSISATSSKSQTSSPSPSFLPAPSVPPISASDTVILKGSLRFDGLNWASVVSSGKEDAVKKVIATELATATKVSADSITISSIQSVNLRSLLSLSKMRRLAGMATEVEYSIKTTNLQSTLSTGSLSSSMSSALTSIKNAVATAAGVSPSSIIVSQPRPFTIEVQPSSSSSSSTPLNVIIGAAVGGGIGGLLIIGVAAYFFWKKPVVEKQAETTPSSSDKVNGVNPMVSDRAAQNVKRNGGGEGGR